jgi:hypothetical protein
MLECSAEERLSHFNRSQLSIVAASIIESATYVKTAVPSIQVITSL